MATVDVQQQPNNSEMQIDKYSPSEAVVETKRQRIEIEIMKALPQKGEGFVPEIIIHKNYARYDEEKKRRETFDEIVDRVVGMHKRNYPMIPEHEFIRPIQLFKEKLVLPSMRTLQFAGPAAEENNARMYNCSFMHIKKLKRFVEGMYLLLSGSGVGFSVQIHHVNQLPILIKPNQEQEQTYEIPDSIEGWALSIGRLLLSYIYDPKLEKWLDETEQRLGYVNCLISENFEIVDGKRPQIKMDYSKIRPAGSPLKKSGGKAPGPEPLKLCHVRIRTLLDNVLDRTKLKPINCHDIMCMIADAVLSGGIRRSSEISLFSANDNEMMECKSDVNWVKQTPWRRCSNNSVVLLRTEADNLKDVYEKVFDNVRNSGEPGIFWTNDYEIGTNPCGEISLGDCEFCNLSEIKGYDIKTQSQFNERARVAAFWGTLQAGYVNFPFLSKKWRRNCEKNALLGASSTGIANKHLLKLNFSEAAKCACDENERIAKMIGINPAKRVTCVKPAGTTSLAMSYPYGVPSGIHALHADYYIRRITVNKLEGIYKFLLKKVPELLEDSKSNTTDAILKTAVKADSGAITRQSETAIDFLERVKKIHSEWIKPGHREGVNTHNVSATVNVRNDEWDIVKEWMWKNKDCYAGISMFPYNENDSIYVQPPHEKCSREEYERIISILNRVDFKEFSLEKEHEDFTDFIGKNVACFGNACELHA